MTGEKIDDAFADEITEIAVRATCDEYGWPCDDSGISDLKIFFRRTFQRVADLEKVRKKFETVPPRTG